MRTGKKIISEHIIPKSGINVEVTKMYFDGLSSDDLVNILAGLKALIDADDSRLDKIEADAKKAGGDK